MRKINNIGHNHYEYIVVKPFEIVVGLRCEHLIVELDETRLPDTAVEWQKYQQWFAEIKALVR
jgi:hypothetical protein